MKLERARDSRGKFIHKVDDMQYKTVRLPVTQIQGISSLCKDDENFSDKVREAIAFYLVHHTG